MARKKGVTMYKYLPDRERIDVARPAIFGTFDSMKALVIKPKNQSEYKFIADLLKKLGIESTALSYDDLEDIGLSKLMRNMNKSKKASRSEIMKNISNWS